MLVLKFIMSVIITIFRRLLEHHLIKNQLVDAIINTFVPVIFMSYFAEELKKGRVCFLVTTINCKYDFLHIMRN